MRAFLLAGLTMLAPLRGGDLDSARAALGKLEGRAPMAGRLSEIYKRQSQAGKGAPRSGEAQLAVAVDAGAAALGLSWDADLLKRADAEEHARDRDARNGMPLREAMKELDPGRVAHLLDQRATLLGLLSAGTLLHVEDASYEGRAARKLELAVPVRVSDDQLRPRVSRSEGRMILWLGADAVPLASELRFSYEGRMGRIFGRFESESTLRTRYGLNGDRLFVAHRDTAESFTDEEGRRTTFVTLDFQAR